MADISKIKLPNGTVYDLSDKKSGYITAQYIENKTDYEIPVSRIGEITIGETSIGTDSTNFPTSKAVVDYVDEKIDQELEAVITGVKISGTSLVADNGVVNIPAFWGSSTIGLMTSQVMNGITQQINAVDDRIPTLTSQLYNDSGFIYSTLSNSGLTISGSSIGHTNVLSSAQTTQAVYPIKIDKNGHISAYGSAVTIPSTYVTTITTTAGAHTAISNQSGEVSFNVPTTAAHVGAASSSHTHGNITNGGDITATAPTIASGDQIIINDNSASKITNGPTFDGSTTTTALTPKGTWETFSKTDQKLLVTDVSETSVSGYPIFAGGPGTATHYISTYGLKYSQIVGTSSQNGSATLQLGNFANKTQGRLVMSSGGTSSTATITFGPSNYGVALALPTSSGTLALISDIPSIMIDSSYNSSTKTVTLLMGTVIDANNTEY